MTQKLGCLKLKGESFCNLQDQIGAENTHIHSQKKTIPLQETLQSQCLSKSKLCFSPWPQGTLPATIKPHGLGETQGFLTQPSLWPQVFWEEGCHLPGNLEMKGKSVKAFLTPEQLHLHLLRWSLSAMQTWQWWMWWFHLNSIKARWVETSVTEPSALQPFLSWPLWDRKTFAKLTGRLPGGEVEGKASGGVAGLVFSPLRWPWGKWERRIGWNLGKGFFSLKNSRPLLDLPWQKNLMRKSACLRMQSQLHLTQSSANS